MRINLMVFAAAAVFTVLSFGSAQAAETPGRLRHVVCVKFKDGTKPEEIKKVEEAFRDLKNKINVVLSLEWGVNISKEKFSKGFTHCFVLTFLDQKDLDIYAKHEAHTAFAKTVLVPVMEEVFVLDYLAKE